MKQTETFTAFGPASSGVSSDVITCCIQGCHEGHLWMCMAKEWKLSERNSISSTAILSTGILWGTSVGCMTGSTQCYSTVFIARFHPCSVEDTVGHPSTSLGPWVTTWSASVALITWGMQPHPSLWQLTAPNPCSSSVRLSWAPVIH